MDILCFNLVKEGYDTLEAYDGPTGLQLALEHNPDLMLLDLMLPGMDGGQEHVKPLVAEPRRGQQIAQIGQLSRP